METKQRELEQHPFFGQFDGDASFAKVMRFAPKLTFWAMAFQDVLRLNESLVADPVFKRIASHHRDEDAHHDQWFLHDIKKLGGPTLDVDTLFGQSCAATRDASYALISEVMSARDDRVRLALVLALEAAGHVFFGRVTRFVDQKGQTERLRYFSLHHFRIEQNHDLFADATEQELASIVLPPAIREEAKAAIDRVFATFGRMFVGLMPQTGESPNARVA
jgi:hypothetical protein